MNPEDALSTFHVRDRDGISPFTREWQAALVAVDRVLRDRGHIANTLGLMGAWRSRQGTTELHLEGRSLSDDKTLLLDMRLEQPVADPLDILPLIAPAPRTAPPGTGAVNLGIKMPGEWLRALVDAHEGDAIAETMLRAAHRLLGRIHLMQDRVKTEDDHLLDLGHAFTMRDELGMTPACGPLRILHATPWSEAGAQLKVDGEDVTVQADAVGLRGPRLRGILVDRNWPIRGKDRDPSMNLLLAPDETVADPSTIDPVVRLRAEAAWENHKARDDRA